MSRPAANHSKVRPATGRVRAVVLAATFLVWMAGVIAGLGGLWAYAATPGPSATGAAGPIPRSSK